MSNTNKELTQSKYVRLKDIKPNPDNPRVIKDDKYKSLLNSIKSFPEMLDIRPIVVNKDMMILGGNQRFKVCQELGIEEVPIIIAKNLTPDQEREFLVKDNNSFGDWSWELLLEQNTEDELIDWGLDIPKDQIEKLEAKEDDYEIPEKVKTDIIEGDLFEIGEHRLLCGDSTRADDVIKVLSGKEPYIMVTDPPYGVNYDPNWRNEADRSNGKCIGASALGQVHWGKCKTIIKLIGQKLGYFLHQKFATYGMQESMQELFNQVLRLITSRSEAKLSGQKITL